MRPAPGRHDRGASYDQGHRPRSTRRLHDERRRTEPPHEHGIIKITASIRSTCARRAEPTTPRRSSSTSPTTRTRSATGRASSARSGSTASDDALLRCYSMSASPEIDAELTVTVKRVRGGRVQLAPRRGRGRRRARGHLPVGMFSVRHRAHPDRRVLRRQRGHSRAVAGQERAHHHRPARAPALRHRDARRSSSTPRSPISSRTRRPPRGTPPSRYRHRFISLRHRRTFVGDDRDADFYLCGPGPFIDLVEGAGEVGWLVGAYLHRAVHVHRRASPDEPQPASRSRRRPPPPERPTIVLKGRHNVATRPATRSSRPHDGATSPRRTRARRGAAPRAWLVWRGG